jgi:hypothetical protein
VNISLKGATVSTSYFRPIGAFMLLEHCIQGLTPLPINFRPFGPECELISRYGFA